MQLLRFGPVGQELAGPQRGDDPNDPLGMALKGKLYECVNLAYEANPDFQSLPPEAQEQARAGKAMMAELLKKRELDIVTDRDLQMRLKIDQIRAAQADAAN